MLTAKRPFPGRDTSEVLEAMLRSDPDWKSLPEEVESLLHVIISKCLAKDPGERYQSSAELHQDLLEYYKTLTAPEPVALGAKSLVTLLRKPRMAVPTVLILLLLCIVGVRMFKERSMIQ